MFSFLASSPPKSHTATLNLITTENGQSKVYFFTNDPSSPYAMQAHIKPGFTIHTPPYHWHKYQTETFLIDSGIMRATLEGADHIIPAGSSITIPPGQHHTFNNASDAEELVISTGLDPMERERDEAFFRNLYSYLEDCRKAGMQPSVPQLMLFLRFFDCYPALPGPRWLARWVSQAVVLVLGVGVGKWVLGYRESYVEYWRGKVE